MADQKITPSEAAEWRAIGEYTATEAAWLLMDIDPKTTWIDETKGHRRVQALACRIRDRFKISDYGNWGTAEMMRGDPTRQRTTLVELRQFAEEAGMHPIILSDAQPMGAEAANPDDTEPDPRHRRTLLRVIAALMQEAKLKDVPDKRAAHAINSILDLTGQGMKADTIAAVIKAAREID